MPRQVSVKISADTAGFDNSVAGMAGNVRRSADQIKAAASQAIGSVSALSAASGRLVKAQAAVADSAGAVRLAEERLTTVRGKSRSTAVQHAAAEESLAKAQRGLILSQRELTAAQNAQGKSKFLASITETEGHLHTISGALLKVGAVGAVGLGLSAKAAIDWESAWTGVTKTVNGSAQEMGVLEGQLRGLARTLPESHEQIAAVAEAAGQLGIQRGSIAEFTKTMVELGDTTNLSSDDAATKLAQFGNIMGTLNGPANEVNDRISRLGATIVGLGNDGASTEADIVDMGLRIAGAGRAVGLSSQQVLGFSSAIASTGINVEAGGTAMSKNLITLDGVVRKGGEGLKVLASTAGESSSAFAKSFRTDAAGATTKFVEGLAKIQDQGGDTTKVLKSLGITGQYQTDVLRRLAGAGDLLSSSLGNANTQYARNSALVDEAAKRYSTTESQAKIALNQVQDSAITAGQAILPVVAEVATVIGHVAMAFGELSGPTRTAAVAIAATAAVMGLVGGGAIRAITGVANLAAAFKAAGVASATAGRAFKIAGLSIPVVGVALFAITSAIEHFASQTTSADESASTFAQAMQTVEGSLTRATAAMNENVRASAIQGLQQKGAFDQAKLLGLSLSDVTDASLGNADAIGRVNSVLQQNIALGPQVSGADGAKRKAALELAGSLGSVAHESINSLNAENDRRAAMNGGVGATRDATKASQDYAAEQQKTADAIQAAVTAATAAAGEYVSMTNAQIAAVQALDAVRSRTDKQRGAGLDKNTKTGQENQGLLNNVITSQSALFSSSVKTQDPEKIAAAYKKATGAVAEAAHDFGKGKKAADDFAASMFEIPPEIKTQIVFPNAKISANDAKSVTKALKDIPPESRAHIVTIAETTGAKAAKVAIEQVKDKTVIARADGSPGGAKQVKAAMDALHDRLVKATARGDKKGANDVENALGRLHDKRVTAIIDADTSGAYQARSALATVHNKVVTVTIQRKGDRGDADGGYIDSTFPNFETGGRIRGSGGPRQDNVAGIDRATGLQTSWVSVGEFVTNARSYANNAGVVETINANPGKSYNLIEAAAGGAIAGLARGGAIASGLTSDSEVLKAVVAQFHVDQARNLNERRQADKELAKAMKKLNDTQSAALDSIKSLSLSLQEPYRSKSTDVDDVLGSLRDGAADLTAFGSQIKQLKALGLDQGVIDQITSDGAINGGELASQILAGGKGLVDSLNQANTALLKAGTALGSTAIGVKSKGFASGGYTGDIGVSTPAGVVHGREYVVNAAGTAANRSVLDAINYGRAKINEHRFMPAYTGGGSSAQHVDRSITDNGQVVLQGDFGSVERALSAARAERRNNLVMARLTGSF